MNLYRFHVPELATAAADSELPLPESEAHHARSVLRLEAGEQIVLFDGAGRWAAGKIVRSAKQGVWVRCTGVPVVDPPPAPALTLATAVPKGERADWLVEQASQLNVTAVQFLDCQRSVVKPRRGAEGGHKLDKWRRLALESAKQCGRTHLLQIGEPTELADIRPRAAASRVLWLDPGPGGTSVSQALADWSGDILALIGPEGGWSPEEHRLLENAVAGGWVRRVRLTKTVLRIETACAAVAAVVMSGAINEPGNQTT